MEWVVLVPMKALPQAKSRLAEASTDPRAHARLVTAIRQDTLAAAASAGHVAAVLAVVDQPGIVAVESFVQTVAGLNAGLAEAAAWAARRWPGHGLAALVGDLPALRPDELTAALAAAATHARGFVPDADGTGTTLLTARPGVALEPRFGPGSARRHAARAVQLPAGPGLRTDTDTAEDLWVAIDIGVGPATAAEVCDHAHTTCSPDACMIEP